MSFSSRIESKLHNRWIAALAAVFSGVVSAWALWYRVVGSYYEYIFYPRIKAVDGYSYPQTRYLLFDCVETLWCLVGLTTSALLFSYLLKGTMHRWTSRFVTAFGILLLVLIGGVFLGVMLRSFGS